MVDSFSWGLLRGSNANRISSSIAAKFVINYNTSQQLTKVYIIL